MHRPKHVNIKYGNNDSYRANKKKSTWHNQGYKYIIMQILREYMQIMHSTKTTLVLHALKMAYKTKHCTIQNPMIPLRLYMLCLYTV